MPLLKFDNEADWLAAREKDITSTDLATLFGLNPYKSRLRLWLEKIGDLDAEFAENNFSKWGRRLQIPVALGICDDEGWQAHDLTGFYYSFPELSFGASLDVLAIDEKRGRINLEVKVAENLSEADGWHKDRAPLHYEFQMQGQMHAAVKHGEPFDCSCLGTLGRRQSTRLYFREYDAELGAMIDEELRAFWKSIDDDVRPDPDFKIDSEILHKLRGPLFNGDVVDLSESNRAMSLAHSYEVLRAARAPLVAEMKQIEGEQAAIETEIHEIMGRNVHAIVGDFQISAREQSVEGSFRHPYSFRRFDFKQKRN